MASQDSEKDKFSRADLDAFLNNTPEDCSKSDLDAFLQGSRQGLGQTVAPQTPPSPTSQPQAQPVQQPQEETPAQQQPQPQAEPAQAPQQPPQPPPTPPPATPAPAYWPQIPQGYVAPPVSTGLQQPAQPPQPPQPPTPTPEASGEMSDYAKKMLYAYEKYAGRMRALQMIYVILRTHFNHGGTVDVNNKRPTKPTKQTLLHYLGFDEKNLTKIFMAVFGKSNPNADQDFEIYARMTGKDVSNMNEFILTKMFELDLETDEGDINDRIDEMAKRLTLPDLLSFDSEMREKIIKIYMKILRREKTEGRLSLGQHKDIAKHCGIPSRCETNIFNEAELTQMISGLAQDDEEPAETAPQVPPVRTDVSPGGQPAPAVPQPAPAAPEPAAEGINYAELAKELKRPLLKLMLRIQSFDDPDVDADELMVKISQTEASKNEEGRSTILGHKLHEARDEVETPADLLAKIAEIFGITEADRLKAKILQMDLEFSDPANAIYHN